MNIPALIVIVAAVILLSFIGRTFQKHIQFFLMGLDTHFSFPEIMLLWKTAQLCRIQEPMALYWSIPVLTRCMTEISAHKTDPAVRRLLSKLYDYRTKIEHAASQKKGITTTRDLSAGERFRIIYPGAGVFSATLLDNGHELVISTPTRGGIITVAGAEWVSKKVSVYFWRKGDASYVFDTVVVKVGVYFGEAVLLLQHSTDLMRTQKRQAVRARCHLQATLFIIDTAPESGATGNRVPTGYRCILENISESGASIRIGGKAVASVQLRLQFYLRDKLIIMTGSARTIEYDKDKNQSCIHFECTDIEADMRNEVLSFVYNILPEGEREIQTAISLAQKDAVEEEAARAQEEPAIAETAETDIQ